MARYEKRKYSATDFERVIATNNEKLNREPDDFSASWLLEGGIGSAIWKTANGDKHYETEKGWKQTQNVHFDVRLPDDTLLTDPQNSVVLHAIQKFSFYFRAGFFGAYPGPKVWGDIIQLVIKVAAWMYLDKERYLPQKYGFKLLDEEGVRLLVTKIAIGGWENALETIPRLLDKLHIKAFGCNAPAKLHINPFALPEEVRTAILKSLVLDKNFIRCQKKIKGKSRDRVPMNYILKLLGRPGVHEKNSKTVMFLSQFNSEQSENSKFNDYTRVSQHPKRSTRILNSGINHPSTEGTIKNVIYRLNAFFKGHTLTETTIPNIRYNPQELRLLAAQYTTTSQHKQLIPFKFGLRILRKSTELVIVHGDALIDSTLEYIHIMHSAEIESDPIIRQQLATLRLPEILKRHMTLACEGLPSRSIGDALNIRIGQKNLHDLDPDSLSLTQALGLLICAQCNLVCMLKPLRSSELKSLRRDCVMFDTFLGGAWMESTVGKTGAEGINMELSRPIPKLTLKAISQLRYFGATLSEIFEDHSLHARNDLFYLPSPTNLTKGHKISLEQKLSWYRGLFYDYIDAPIDEHGRRFYPSPHEFRKFFILLMYWHEQNIGFSCAAWMAGHLLTEHTRAYTDPSVSVEEVSLWEAECIEDKIIEFEADNAERHDIDGLVALHEAVKARFGVGRVEGLHRKAYIEFLQDLRSEGAVTIKPYFIFAPGSQEPDGIDLAFKYEDKQDEQF